MGKKVVVVDCNITTPHLAYYLGASSCTATINNVFRGDVDILFAPSNFNGLMFIPASEKLEDLNGIKIDELKNHIRKLANSSMFDFILLDSAPGLGKEALSVLHACEELIFVTVPTVPNISDAARCAEVANKIGIENFKIVLNMTRGKRFELRYKNAEEFFKYPTLGAIPFDEKIMDSTAQGIPMLWYRPFSDITRHYMKIAANLVGIKHKKKNLFNSIFTVLKNLTMKRGKTKG